MSSRVAPMLGLACGVFALACTAVGPSPMDLESPEDEDILGLIEVLPDQPVVDPVDPTLDTGEALTNARCTVETGDAQAVPVDDPRDPGGGRLLTELPGGEVMGLPLRHTSFDTIVVGTVAETTVMQRFANPFEEPIEVVYTFPLPHDGAVDDYWLRIGARTIEGEIHRRAKANEIYRKAKKSGHSAGLLEQERPNIFTQRVANVPPGQTIEVSMHVVQPLVPDRGRYELALPTVVGPRYIPGTPQAGSTGTGMLADTDVVPDASRITPPIVPAGYRSCGDLEIAVSIDAGGPITALGTTSHRIVVEPDHLGAMVHLDERYALLNRDFVLSWRHDGAEPTATAQAQPDADGDGGYFTLTIQPPIRVDPKTVPGREIVFVVDASGSMSGEPMDLAKATMRRFIEGLGPDDGFQVIRFSESASGLGTELLPVTADNVSTALSYVNALEGQGGTAMTEGVRAALSLPHRSDRLRYVVFLTDGYIGNEAEIFGLIEQEIGAARLFALGVGSSVNRYLLDGMARMGRGAVTYVDLEQPTAPVVERIYDKLRAPALIDLSVDIEGLDAHDVVPALLPDLFVGEPVVLFGRYEGSLTGTITIRGRRAGEEVELPVNLRVARDEDTDGVRSMWARERIDELQFEPSLAWAGAARSEARTKEIIGLSLRHRVLTEHTAFVAVDRTRTVQGHSSGRTEDGSTIDGHSSGKTVVQGVQIPGGVAHQSVWGHIGPPPSTGNSGLGLVGKGAGGGTGSGYGRGTGSGFGGRGKRVPRVRQAKAKVSGALDRTIIRRIVRAHINEVRHCYNQGLVSDPSLSGRVVVQFVIGATGAVLTSLVGDDSTLPDTTVSQCVAKVVKRWHFPKTPGGGNVVVRYPFVLSPG